MVHSDIIDFFQREATKIDQGDLIYKCPGGRMYHDSKETFVMRFVPNDVPFRVDKIIDDDDDEVEN